MVVPSGEPFIWETTVPLRSPVTSPEVLTVNGVLAIPFTVLISWFDPFWLSALLLIIVTPVPAIPFTVVVRVFVLEVFETVLTRGTDVPVMPFTEVVNVFSELVLLILFTTGAVTETPFTTDVSVLMALLSVCVVVEEPIVVGAQSVPFQPNTCPLVGDIAAILLPCS